MTQISSEPPLISFRKTLILHNKLVHTNQQPDSQEHGCAQNLENPVW